MDADSARLFDDTLDHLIDKTTEALKQQSAVVLDFVDSYKELRELEIREYRNRPEWEFINGEAKPCLLALIFRPRPVSQATHVVPYFPNGEKLTFAYIDLAKISGRFTDHIPINADGTYSPKRIVRMKELRYQHEEQREWIMGVIEQINSFNISAMRLKETYLTLVDLHYNIHKTAARLSPAGYHYNLSSDKLCIT